MTNSRDRLKKHYPEIAKAYERVSLEQYELFASKMMDYGKGNISVGSNLDTEEEIHIAMTGLWFRINDKVQRIKNLLMGNRESAVDEPLEDAFLDMSNYGIMATIVKNGKWGK